MTPTRAERAATMRELREQTGWEVSEMARELDIEPSQLAAMERGERPVRMVHILAARYLCVRSRAEDACG